MKCLINFEADLEPRHYQKLFHSNPYRRILAFDDESPLTRMTCLISLI